MQMFAIIVCPLMLTPGSCLSDMGEKNCFLRLDSSKCFASLNRSAQNTDTHATD